MSTIRPTSPYNYPHTNPEVEEAASRRAAAARANTRVVAWLLGWTGASIIPMTRDSKKQMTVIWMVVFWVLAYVPLAIFSLGIVPLIMWLIAVILAYSGFDKDLLAIYRYEEETRFIEAQQRGVLLQQWGVR